MAKKKSKTKQFFVLSETERYEVIGETGKYYLCEGGTQFRKLGGRGTLVKESVSEKEEV